MNDIKRLLAAALNEESAPMTLTFDPEEDVARGRRQIARRRAVLAGSVAAAVLVFGGGATLIAANRFSSDSEGTHVATTVDRQTVSPAAPADQRITLVAYTGKQPKGYKVTQVPDGWVIQGGSESSLVIAPKDATDKSPDSFVDKLTVLSTSSDTPPEGRTEGEKVQVGDVTGYYRAPGDGYQILTYQDKTSGRWVDVQVPPALHWDAARTAEFATGVTVIGGAGDSHG